MGTEVEKNGNSVFLYRVSHNKCQRVIYIVEWKHYYYVRLMYVYQIHIQMSIKTAVIVVVDSGIC